VRDDPSRFFGLAASRDGYRFERVSDQPVLSPTVEGFDGATIQDPRIIRMGEWYYVTDFSFREATHFSSTLSHLRALFPRRAARSANAPRDRYDGLAAS